MRLVIQRILSGHIEVDKITIASTGPGMAVFVGIEKEDTSQDLLLCAKKIDGCRIFEDENGKMSLSLPKDQPLLLIPQFTLLGSLNKGFRPDFTQAEAPDIAKTMYKQLLVLLKNDYQRLIQSGQFAADMKVFLCIDGPVTLIFDTRRLR